MEKIKNFFSDKGRLGVAIVCLLMLSVAMVSAVTGNTYAAVSEPVTPGEGELTPKTVQVTLNFNGGMYSGETSNVVIEVTVGEKYNLPRSEELSYPGEGKVFIGWENESKEFITSETTLEPEDAKDHQLNAVWNDKNNKYDVILDPVTGEVNPSSIKVYMGGPYGELPEPTYIPMSLANDNYDFAGWYTSENGGDKIESTTVVKQADTHTLYARWVKKKDTSDQTPPVEGNPTPPGGGNVTPPGEENTPTGNDCNSAGYYCEQGSTEAKECPAGYYCPSGANDKNSCGDHKWSLVGASEVSACYSVYYINYDLSFDSEDERMEKYPKGHGPTTCKLNEECAVSSLVLEQDGYVFQGYKNKDTGETVAAGATVGGPNQTEDISLIAIWSKTTEQNDCNSAGYYCEQDSTEAKKCSAGYYCPSGTTERKYCGERKWSLTGASEAGACYDIYYIYYDLDFESEDERMEKYPKGHGPTTCKLNEECAVSSLKLEQDGYVFQGYKNKDTGELVDAGATVGGQNQTEDITLVAIWTKAIDQTVDKNAPTGSLPLILVSMIGIGTLGVGLYYYKKMKTNNIV